MTEPAASDVTMSAPATESSGSVSSSTPLDSRWDTSVLLPPIPRIRPFLRCRLSTPALRLDAAVRGGDHFGRCPPRTFIVTARRWPKPQRVNGWPHATCRRLASRCARASAIAASNARLPSSQSAPPRRSQCTREQPSGRRCGGSSSRLCGSPNLGSFRPSHSGVAPRARAG